MFELRWGNGEVQLIVLSGHGGVSPHSVNPLNSLLGLPWPQSTLNGQYTGRAFAMSESRVADAGCHNGVSISSLHIPPGSPALRMAFSHHSDMKQSLINNPQPSLLLQHSSPAGKGKQGTLTLGLQQEAFPGPGPGYQGWATWDPHPVMVSRWYCVWPLHNPVPC